MRKLTQEGFIERCYKLFGDRYDYSNAVYKSYDEHVIVICRKHGPFPQTPHSHFRGNGCKKCHDEKISKERLRSVEEFIACAEITHGKKYDYSKVDYRGSSIKVQIVCPTHGVFEQTPKNHIRGRNCPHCGKIKRYNTKRKTTEDFVKRANVIHNGLYDYSNVQYTNSKDAVLITCKHHGLFEQVANDHLRGRGCPICVNKVSNPEIELQKFIKALGYKIVTNNRKIIKGKELDIYIPELNKAIEFNGAYWHYHKDKFVPGKHAQKSNLCLERGVKLLHLREDLWMLHKEKMKNVIIKFLNHKQCT